MRRCIPLSLLLAILACPCLAADGASGAIEPARRPALTTVAEVRAQPGQVFNAGRSLSLSGIVTLADPARNMLVLQDATGAIALHPDPPGVSVQPGRRVVLKASSCAPYVFNCPTYPFRPMGSDVREIFEAPDNEGDYRLTRMRAWLRPPATGAYTFWISSDDSSELWLSPGADPADARRIALVPVGLWTDRRDWFRFPAQRSESVILRGGESYYIEALQEQQLEQSHLAVAWEGPALKRDVIDGRYLVPWHDEAGGRLPVGAVSGTTRGVLREYWTDYSVATLEGLTSGSTDEGGLTVRGMEVSPLADGVWPEPRPIDPGQIITPEDVHRWVKGEGAVRFAASDGASTTLELVNGQNRMLVRVDGWKGSLPPLRARLRAKFRGVCLGMRDSNGHLIAGFIWTPSEQDVSFFEEPGSQPQASAAPSPATASAGPGGHYFTRGVVTFNDRVRDRDRLFVQDASGGIFVSQPKHLLRPQPQVGQSVEIGGQLLAGKYAPATRAWKLNILGWQDLPAPAILPTEAPEASYRDARWTEMEGVGRAVNADGAVVLMGKQVALPAWIGRTDRAGLEHLINATVRVRGVMSLDTFDTPVLLVPSRSFVEIVEPAPDLPAQPVPIASLKKAGSEAGWVHKMKVAGAVTYRSDRYFCLQDESGSVRVQTHNAPPSQIGGAVEAVGFPGGKESAARLTEADWRPLADGPDVRPASLNLQNLDMGRNGMLVKIEARLLSQKDRSVELQAGQHVFEAVLENSKDKLPEFAPGSALAVTGVCILEAAPSSVSLHGAPDSPSVALTRLLLRGPLDVTLLQGPPWWTWKRTVFLISGKSPTICGPTSWTVWG